MVLEVRTYMGWGQVFCLVQAEKRIRFHGNTNSNNTGMPLRAQFPMHDSAKFS